MNMASTQKDLEYLCEICGVEYSDRGEYEAHIESSEHIMEINNVLKTPSHSHFSAPPRDYKDRRDSIIPCTLCNMELNGPISYQQHIEGRFHNLLLKQRILEVSLPYRSSEETEPWEHGHSPDSSRYYQGIRNRWNSNSKCSSRSISGKSRTYTGLFYCVICDTHHRSWAHYTCHLASEHKIEAT